MSRHHPPLHPGGLFLAFAERGDDGTTGPYYPLGNVVDRGLEPTGEGLERLADRPDGTLAVAERGSRRQGLRLAFAAEGQTAANLRRFLAGGAASTRPAERVAVADEAVYLQGTTTGRLVFPLADGDPVASVTSLDGATAYTEGTDYAVDHAGNGIHRLTGGAIPDGAWVVAAYDRAAPPRTVFAARRRTAVPGAARLYLRPRSGPSMVWALSDTVLEAGGTAGLDPRPEAPLQLPFALLVRPDPDNPAAPFGEPEIAEVPA